MRSPDSAFRSSLEVDRSCANCGLALFNHRAEGTILGSRRERQRSPGSGMIARADRLFRITIPTNRGLNIIRLNSRRSFLGPEDEMTLFAACEETFLDHVADQL